MFISMLPQASTVVQHCLKVQPGDEVLLVSDESLGDDMSRAFRAAAVQAGAKESFITYEPSHRYPPKEHGRFAGASLSTEDIKIPAPLLAAMGAADAILLLNSDLVMFFAKAFKELIQRKRIVSLAYLTFPNAQRMLPSSAQEVEDIRRSVEVGGEALGSARQARVTSPQGTDINFTLGQYPVMVHSGVVGYGSMPLLPAGQVVRVPDDGSASGRLVVDRTISVHDYKALEEPITFHVENGDVVQIEGGLEAKRLQKWLDDLNFPGMYHLTELAFGTNPRCRLIGVLPGCEDTHSWGTVSLALGCDVHLGGSVRAPAHCDMTLHSASLELDGKTIIKDGRHLLSV